MTTVKRIPIYDPKITTVYVDGMYVVRMSVAVPINSSGNGSGHSHANKTTLDQITTPFTSELKTIYDGKAAGNHNHALANLTEKSYNSLTEKPTIPAALADLSPDSTHRTVTDTEKNGWDGKAAGNHNHSLANLTEKSYNSLTEKPTIPAALADLSPDSTHRTVTDTEKNGWDGKAAGNHNHSLANLTEKSYSSLTEKPTIPAALADLSPDSTHRTVTDTEKTGWDGKAAGNHNHSLASLSEKSYNSLTEKPTIPAALADLSPDSTHRLVTDTEKTGWDGKAAGNHNHALANLSEKSYNSLTEKPAIPSVGGDADPLITRFWQLDICDSNTSPTTGDLKRYLIVPLECNGWVLVIPEGFCTTVSSSGLPNMMVRNVTTGHDMLTTSITIDANENTSYTATTRSVVNNTYKTVSTGDIIAVDLDATGTGTKGLSCLIGLRKP